MTGVSHGAKKIHHEALSAAGAATKPSFRQAALRREKDAAFRGGSRRDTFITVHHRFLFFCFSR